MLGQICLNFATIPDPRSLTMSELRFFYNVLRGSLLRLTKPKK